MFVHPHGLKQLQDVGRCVDHRQLAAQLAEIRLLVLILVGWFLIMVLFPAALGAAAR